MKTVFLDTVGMLALWDDADQWHSAADAAMTALDETPCRMVTTPFVVLECGNAASRSSYRQEVASLRDELATFGNLILPTEHEEENAWQAYVQGQAGEAGIVDHLSFVVMRRLGISQAFTNDRHFVSAGFEVLF